VSPVSRRSRMSGSLDAQPEAQCAPNENRLPVTHGGQPESSTPWGPADQTVTIEAMIVVVSELGWSPAPGSPR
jgi:hypothetical protein